MDNCPYFWKNIPQNLEMWDIFYIFVGFLCE